MYDRCAFRTFLHNGLCTKIPISSSINSRNKAQPISAHTQHFSAVPQRANSPGTMLHVPLMQRPRRHAIVHSTSDHVPSTASACCRSTRKGRWSLVERPNADARGDVKSARATQATGLVSPITGNWVTRPDAGVKFGRLRPQREILDGDNCCK
jgi:hypothetical protein